MEIDEIREYCLNKTKAEEYLPFGPDTLVFKVNNKIFLLLSLDENPHRFNVKCSPDKAIELRDNFACVLPGYHMNKKHWNTIICDGTVSDRLIKEWIDDSYALVLTKTKKS